MQTVQRLVLGVWISLLAGACGGAPEDGNAVNGHGATTANGITVNGVNLNGLKLNGLKLNGLKLNGLKLNGLKLNGLQLNGVTLTSAQRASFVPIWKKMVECALPAGTTATMDGGTTMYSAAGALGLAPEWATEPLSVTGGMKVSGCIAALGNKYGVSVPVSLRSPSIGSTAQERVDYTIREGAFLGDLFGEYPWLMACPAWRSPAEYAQVKARNRHCADGNMEESDGVWFSQCGDYGSDFSVPGGSLCDSGLGCAGYSNEGYWTTCNMGSTPLEPVTVWLKP